MLRYAADDAPRTKLVVVSNGYAGLYDDMRVKLAIISNHNTRFDDAKMTYFYVAPDLSIGTNDGMGADGGHGIGWLEDS